MALLLRKQGVQKIRPLLGGLEGWKKMGYPVAVYHDEEGSTDSEAAARA